MELAAPTPLPGYHLPHQLVTRGAVDAALSRQCTSTGDAHVRHAQPPPHPAPACRHCRRRSADRPQGLCAGLRQYGRQADPRRRRLRHHARDDRGAVLLRSSSGAQGHHRGPPRPADQGEIADRRRAMRATARRPRRHLALRRGGPLFRLSPPTRQRGHPWRDLHARNPVRRRRRHRRVRHHLSRLVSGPDAAHPFQGLHRRDHVAHGAAVLPRRRVTQGVRDGRALHRTRQRPGHHERSRRHSAPRRRQLDRGDRRTLRCLPRSAHHLASNRPVRSAA